MALVNAVENYPATQTNIGLKAKRMCQKVGKRIVEGELSGSFPAVEVEIDAILAEASTALSSGSPSDANETTKFAAAVSTGTLARYVRKEMAAICSLVVRNGESTDNKLEAFDQVSYLLLNK